MQCQKGKRENWSTPNQKLSTPNYFIKDLNRKFNHTVNIYSYIHYCRFLDRTTHPWEKLLRKVKNVEVSGILADRHVCIQGDGEIIHCHTVFIWPKRHF